MLFCLSGFISQAANLARQGHQVCQSFSLEELMEATNNFDISTFLGEGSYGKVKSSLCKALRLFVPD